MKLYLLEPTSNFSTNIEKISNRFKLNVTIQKSEKLNKLIIIADGTPDDYVLAIICFHLDGEESLGAVKPVKKGLDVITQIPFYLDKFKSINGILIMADQEEKSLDDIHEIILRLLKEHSIEIHNYKVFENRLGIFNCRRANREFKLILIINGLDKKSRLRHTVEDHLIEAARIFLKIDDSSTNNAKDSWNSIKDRQWEVFDMLRKNIENVEGLFPQHVRGFKKFKEVVYN